jgi:ligand-binding sensor domain-containing protein
MKTFMQSGTLIITITLLLTLFINLNAQNIGRWEILNEGGLNNRAIDFINDKVGWIGGNGKLLKTEDSGETWRNIPIEFGLDRIDFINESVGWATQINHGNGETQILKTNDGGHTWIVQEEFLSPYTSRSYCAINSQVLYAVSGMRSVNNWWVMKTMDGGISWEDVLSYESGLHNNNVTAIAIDRNRSKWIGTGNGVLATFDDRNVIVYSEYNSGLPGNWVSCIAIDNMGNKWIGTSEGLAMFDGSNWRVYDRDNSDLPSDRVYCIAIDSNGNKWIGTGGALAMFDGSNWDVYHDQNSGLPHSSVNAIAIDSSSNKWIGTRGGLAMFDDINWSVYNSSNSGLPDNNISCVTIDSSDNKWIGTERGGMALFDGNNWNIYKYRNFELTSIDFFSEEIGIVTGRSDEELFVLRTTDGGNTWIEMDYSEYSNIYDFKFIDASTTYFLGDKDNEDGILSYLCVSNDTLGSWSTISESVYPINFYHVLDNYIACYSLSNDTLRKSIDGGITWEVKQQIWRGGGISLLY